MVVIILLFNIILFNNVGSQKQDTVTQWTENDGQLSLTIYARNGNTNEHMTFCLWKSGYEDSRRHKIKLMIDFSLSSEDSRVIEM